jgi:hypothetical protein
MDLIQNKYHIIRIGDFATNGNTKLLYGVFACILCIDDYISNNSSSDCLTIMAGSSIIWTMVEMCMHMNSTRLIKPMFIYASGYKYQLPRPVGTLLQGIQEGGVITTVGLYYGDRLYHIGSLVHLHVFILFVVINVLSRTVNVNTTAVASKRQVNTSGSLLGIGSVTVYNMMMLYQYPTHLQRQLSMFFAMIYICSVWTFFSWYKGFRTIEIHVRNPLYCLDTINLLEESSLQEYTIKPVNNWDTFMVLGYDIIFEVGVAYVFFYNLFLL